MTPSISDLIADRLTGKEFTKRLVLLAYLRSRGIKISERGMRETIVEMQEKEGRLIISGSKGYKLCESVAEYEQAISYLSSYIFSLLRKRRAMKNNFQRLVKPQLFQS